MSLPIHSIVVDFAAVASMPDAVCWLFLQQSRPQSELQMKEMDSIAV
jgi:hypothetical protein